MLKICLFAGTTEGRELAGKLSGICEVTACVATEYGDELLEGISGVTVRAGRTDASGMRELFDAHGFDIIIDATHPFAQIVSRNIAEAAQGRRLLRVLREEDAPVAEAVYVQSVSEARDYLLGIEGNIFITTGSKELALYKGLDMNRVWARVLPLASSLEACAQAGVVPAHIIAAQGPFCEEVNLAQLRAISAKYIVTKESGKTGGFPEKISAAGKAGAVPVIIGRPKEEGISVQEAVRTVCALSDTVTKVYITGIGPGDRRLLTPEASELLSKCDAVIGAASVTACLGTSKPVYNEYLPSKVSQVLAEHKEIKTAALVMRGDTGFFSGAKKLKEALSRYSPEIIPGISAPVYLASRLGVSWDDARFISLHGKNGNIVRNAARHKKLFVLTGGENTVKSVIERLCTYGLGDVNVTVGENLSLPQERIITSKASGLSGRDFDSLSTLYIENPSAAESAARGIPDEQFIRGDTPMTKAEVRAFSVSRLNLAADSVVYDIGSGTGSVSVECALSAFDGTVYAIEKDKSALELTVKNSVKFMCDNIVAVEGTAPDALEGLPVPTHAFIGGSSGNLDEIINALICKNPHVRIVINTVTLETLSEAAACAKRFSVSETVLMSCARSKKAGRYSLMTAQNPVYIITLQNPEDTDNAR